ncbi:SIR2 family protein, partial [Vibrio parahaemolyticus]
SKHLVSTVDTSGLDGEELEVWERFKALLESGTDLESALHEIRLSETLTDAVVGATWNLLNPQDLEVFKSSLL